MDIANKLELHYYLNDSSHTMDAVVNNKCEAEILAVAYEAISVLSLDVSIDVEALQKGGIKDIWRVLGDNNAQIALVVSVIALVLSQVPNIDSDLTELQKEETKLSIEEKKLTIEKLKNELKEDNVSDETLKSSVIIINNNYKIVTRKSNFYKTLSQYNKVSQIGITTLNPNNVPLSDETIIKRKDFKNYILISHDLKPVTDADAVIEIVAPVLKEGRAKWKGIYNKEHISFTMGDNEFKNSVLSKRISFKNGSAIACVLLIHKKLDETGEVVTSGYTVETVLDNIDSGASTETEQGKKYRFTKKQRDDQRELFDDKDA